MNIAGSFLSIVICIICTCDGRMTKTKSHLTCASDCAGNADCKGYLFLIKRKRQMCSMHPSVYIPQNLYSRLKSTNAKFFIKKLSLHELKTDKAMTVMETMFRSYATMKPPIGSRINSRKQKNKMCAVATKSRIKKYYNPKDLIFGVGFDQKYMFDKIEGKFHPLPSRLSDDAAFTLDPHACRLFSYSIFHTEIRSVLLDNTKLVTHVQRIKDVIAMNFDNLHKFLFYSTRSAVTCFGNKKLFNRLWTRKRLTAMALIERAQKLFLVHDNIMYMMFYSSKCKKARHTSYGPAETSSPRLTTTPDGSSVYYCAGTMFYRLSLKTSMSEKFFAEGDCQSLDLKGRILWVYTGKSMTAKVFKLNSGGKPVLRKTIFVPEGEWSKLD